MTLPTFDDGDFSEDRIGIIYTKDCANTLGNVVKRITTLVQKSNHQYQQSPLKTISGYELAFSNRELDRAAHVLWEELRILNQMIEHVAPWNFLKSKNPKIHEYLDLWLDWIYSIGHWLTPFMPKTATIIKNMKPNQSDLILFPKRV